MSRRLALLIATYQYQDAGLRRLTAPAHDAESLAAVLRDPDIAGFEVATLINEPHHRVGEAIGDFYRDRRRDDLTLLYFTGHGLKDDDGRLYLAMANTRRDSLLFTGLSAEQIDQAMEGCASRQKVLILDCCYSGAFPAGKIAKADAEVHTLQRFHGRGRTVLTASDATQYSFEGNEPHGQASRSVFTRYLVEGLRDGSADLDGDGDITLDELYSYVHDRVVEETPQQRPKKQANVEGRTVIARNINWTLPGYLSNAIRSPIANDRLAALDGLAHLHRVGNDTVRARVRAELEGLANDDSKLVSAAAAHHLRAVAPAPSEATPAADTVLEVPASPSPPVVAPSAPPPPPRSLPVVAPPEPVEAPAASGDPRRRKRLLIGGVIALAIAIAAVTTTVLLTRDRSSSGTSATGGAAYDITAPGLAISPDGRWLYVAINQLASGGREGKSDMVAVDVTAGAARGHMVYGPGAGDAAISPDGQELYVASHFTRDWVAHILKLGPQPVGIGSIDFSASESPPSRADRSLVISPDGRYLYLADPPTRTVYVADLAPAKVTSKAIAVSGGGVGRLVLSPKGDRLYVVGKLVSSIDTATGTVHEGLLAAGDDPRGVAISPDGKRLYVADRASGFINVVDTAADKMAASIRPGCTYPITIALSRDGSRLYIGCESSNVITVVDIASGSTIGQPIVVGPRPSSTVLSPDGSRLYVATIDGYDIKITAIDTAGNKTFGSPVTAGTWLAPASAAAPAGPTS